jgi:hypothetical protein
VLGQGEQIVLNSRKERKGNRSEEGRGRQRRRGQKGDSLRGVQERERE